MSLENLKRKIERKFKNKKEPCIICRKSHLIDAKSFPLFHEKEIVPNEKILFVLQAPNEDDTFIYKKITVEDSKDPTGKFINEIIKKIREQRQDINVYVANSVLCLPRKIGNNRDVSCAQLCACNRWLRQSIDIIQPQVVVSFGESSFNAIILIDPVDISFSKELTQVKWYSRTLISTHHPRPLIIRKEDKGIKKDVVKSILSILS